MNYNSWRLQQAENDQSSNSSILVKFHTRGQNVAIGFNLNNYYKSSTTKNRSVFYEIKSRDLRPTNRLALRKSLVEADVPTLIRAKTSCEDKASALE